MIIFITALNALMTIIFLSTQRIALMTHQRGTTFTALISYIEDATQAIALNAEEMDNAKFAMKTHIL